jgi:hypothetical protein
MLVKCIIAVGDVGGERHIRSGVVAGDATSTTVRCGPRSAKSSAMNRALASYPTYLGLCLAASFLTIYTLPTTPMRPDEQPEAPSWPWRTASSFTMGGIGVLCRSFLYTLSNTEVHGLNDFLELLDERENVEGRTRGLITGSSSHLPAA